MWGYAEANPTLVGGVVLLLTAAAVLYVLVGRRKK